MVAKLLPVSQYMILLFHFGYSLTAAQSELISWSNSALNGHADRVSQVQPSVSPFCLSMQAMTFVDMLLMEALIFEAVLIAFLSVRVIESIA